MSGGYLRPEARPLGLSDLSEPQLRVAERVVDCLKAASEQLKIAGFKDNSELDPQRSSRILFVSGEPGTGKTSVYLSLRQQFESGTKPTSAESKGAKLMQEINDLRDQIHWLKPLDMEPMTETINFLAAVLVRIQDAWEKRGDESSPGLLDRPDHPKKALDELRRFQNDMVSAWDGNLRARAAQVEPDTYAVEVINAEKARLSVNQRLQEIFSKIYYKNKENRKLLVLVVDDLYLNPEVSIELLRLLRMISSPALMVLLMGDYDVLEYLFIQQMIGKYSQLAGRELMDMDENYREILMTRAGAVATTSLRKLIPPNQRLELEALTVEEALKFEMPGVNGGGGLKQALDGRFVLKSPRTTLATLLSANQQTKEARYKEQLVYTGLHLLEMPPRHAYDLTRKASEEIHTKGIDRTIQLVGEELLTSLDEQTIMTADKTSRLARAVKSSGLYFGDMQLDTTGFKIKLEADHPTIKVGQVERLDARVRWKLVMDDKEITEWAPRARGWFVLFHDILVLGREENLLGENIVERVDVDQVEWIMWKSQEGDAKAFKLKTPRLRTFWQLDRLRWSWNDLVLQARRANYNIHAAWYFYYWIDTIVRIFERSELPEKQVSDQAPLKDDVAKLKERFENLVSTGEMADADRVLAKEWHEIVNQQLKDGMGVDGLGEFVKSFKGAK